MTDARDERAAVTPNLFRCKMKRDFLRLWGSRREGQCQRECLLNKVCWPKRSTLKELKKGDGGSVQLTAFGPREWHLLSVLCSREGEGQ